ncbi:MAG: Hpt domain-containing protein [Saprospiraceae bacterium]|nr:Hpt domain-containing protein [Saprospiraceae bacterium]
MIDRDGLARMMDGDYELADRLISAFRTQMQTQLPLLRSYQEAGQFDLLENAVHVIKTQCRYLGLSGLAEHAEQVEADVRNAPADVGSGITQLQVKLAELLDTLDAQDDRTTS